MEIRQTVSAIYDDMDYWTGTDNEQLAILRDIVHKQNILINHLLEQTIIHEEVPSNPAGVLADTMSFQEWFNTAGEILEDMKEGKSLLCMTDAKTQEKLLHMKFMNIVKKLSMYVYKIAQHEKCIFPSWKPRLENINRLSTISFIENKEKKK